MDEEDGMWGLEGKVAVGLRKMAEGMNIILQGILDHSV